MILSTAACNFLHSQAGKVSGFWSVYHEFEYRMDLCCYFLSWNFKHYIIHFFIPKQHFFPLVWQMYSFLSLYLSESNNLLLNFSDFFQVCYSTLKVSFLYYTSMHCKVKLSYNTKENMFFLFFEKKFIHQVNFKEVRNSETVKITHSSTKVFKWELPVHQHLIWVYRQESAVYLFWKVHCLVTCTELPHLVKTEERSHLEHCWRCSL